MANEKLNLVCSDCFSVNRVPSNRLGDGPICGKCKTSLLPTAPIELTDESFAKFTSKSDIPVLVDFWASWCGPCRMMAPEFAEAATVLSPDVILAKLDTDASPQTASQFALSGIPTIILMHRGIETTRQSGALQSAQIVQWVRQNLS